MVWKEVTSKRSIYGKHYQDGNRGTFVSVVGTPLNYDSGSGLETVDLRPQRINNATLDGWRITANGFHYALGKPGDKGGEDGWVGFGGKRGQYWILFRLSSVGHLHWPTKTYNQLGSVNYDRANLSVEHGGIEGPAGTIYTDSRVTWGNVVPGMDLVWSIDGRRLKEDINITAGARSVLETSASTPDNETYATMIFDLDAVGIPKWAVRGLPRLMGEDIEDAEGEISLLTDLNELIAFMPIDYVFPTVLPEGTLVRPERRLYKRVFLHNGEYKLAVGVKLSELKTLPAGGLTFDPTFTTQPSGTAGKDTTIDKDAPNEDRSVWDRIFVYNAGAFDRKGFIEFDLSSIDPGSICDSATLHLTTAHTYTGTFSSTLYIYSLASGVATWTEDGLNYNNYKASTAWPGSAGANTAGTDYESTAIGSTTGFNKYLTPITISLSASRVEDWFSSTNTNYGIMVKSSSDYAVFYSSDYTTASYRPKLVVEYQIGTPDPVEFGVEAGLAPRAVNVGMTADVSNVLIASVPPIAINSHGNLFWDTRGPKLSALLFMVDGSNWVQVDGSANVSTHGLTVTRWKAFLVPQ